MVLVQLIDRAVIALMSEQVTKKSMSARPSQRITVAGGAVPIGRGHQPGALRRCSSGRACYQRRIEATAKAAELWAAPY
ncbi:MAG: hypothetical protein M3443_14800 [Actinomycetota bacterium]|nr:hypothetical protein [Actinomycetota bacterium]